MDPVLHQKWRCQTQTLVKRKKNEKMMMQAFWTTDLKENHAMKGTIVPEVTMSAPTTSGKQTIEEACGEVLRTLNFGRLHNEHFQVGLGKRIAGLLGRTQRPINRLTVYAFKHVQNMVNKLEQQHKMLMKATIADVSHVNVNNSSLKRT